MKTTRKRKVFQPLTMPRSKPRSGKRVSQNGARIGARIKRLRDAADFRDLHAGQQRGIPVSVLKSFAAPPRQYEKTMS